MCVCFFLFDPKKQQQEQGDVRKEMNCENNSQKERNDCVQQTQQATMLNDAKNNPSFAYHTNNIKQNQKKKKLNLAFMTKPYTKKKKQKN